MYLTRISITIPFVHRSLELVCSMFYQLTKWIVIYIRTSDTVSPLYAIDFYTSVVPTYCVIGRSFDTSPCDFIISTMI